MALKIIGAGFGRTGTLSMKAALEHLGYDKCHHMTELLKNPDELKAWHDVMNGASADWDQLFDGYTACVDFPFAIMYQKIADHYPDAKIILNVRPSDGWYASTRKTIYELSTLIPDWMIRFVPHMRRFKELADGLIWDGLFKGRFEHEPEAISIYEHHIDEVKSVIPKDRLLVMNVKDGWAPLCAFLGVAEPDIPFPNVNDSAEFQQRIRQMKLMRRLPVFAGIAAFSIVSLVTVGVMYAKGIFG